MKGGEVCLVHPGTAAPFRIVAFHARSVLSCRPKNFIIGVQSAEAWTIRSGRCMFTAGVGLSLLLSGKLAAQGGCGCPIGNVDTNTISIALGKMRWVRAYLASPT